MKTIITGVQVARFAASVSSNDFLPDEVRTLRVHSRLQQTESNFTFGCRLHALLSRIADHSPLSRGQKAQLPWLTSLRTELRSMGVGFIEPEVRIDSDELPTGRCDLLVHGGPTPIGVVEIKVTEAGSPTASTLLQLGGYLSLVAGLPERGARNPWGAIAHASLREGCWRIFVFRRTHHLRNASTKLLAA